MTKITITENTVKQKTSEDINKENEELEKQLKGDDMTIMLVDSKDRALNFGVVGVGQAGGRLAEQFYQRGYPTIALNTATQDLKYNTLPEKQKLFLDLALGGTGKDLDLGAQAIEEYADVVLKMMEDNFADCDVVLLAMSGGGGTGSGGAENMAKLASQLGKPVVMIFALPMSSEDALSKHNSVQTLSKLAKLAQSDVVNSLMVVDNAKIEMLYPNLPMTKFWETANNAIVDPIHLFNSLSASPSKFTSLDPMDFGKAFLGSGDCTIYGMIEVEDYMREESIAEAIIENMENGLLASEFDLTQTRSVGVIITGSEKVLSEIPAVNLEYGFAMLNKITSDGTQVYRGVYSVEDQGDTLKVYSLFGGLGLPEERVNELKLEAERHMKALENKETKRASNMNIDLGKTKVVSAADTLHKKITTKNSAMGKLTNNSKRIIDRRRK